MHIQPASGSDPTRPDLARSGTFEEGLERRLGPVIRALLWTAVFGYLSFVIGGELTGTSAIPFWLRAAPTAALVLLALLGSVHRASRHYGPLGLAALAWLQLGIFFNGYLRPEGLLWVLPAYTLLPIASSPIWLKRRQFVAAALLCTVCGPVPLVALSQPARWEVYQYLDYMAISMVAATVLNGYQMRLIRQHLELEERLRLRADIDDLTGVATRARFLEQARRLLQASIAQGSPLAVLYLDADHFKQLNDTHGHAAGDAALAGLGCALRDNLRESDLVGRIGGEEFAVLLPEMGLDEACEMGEQLRRAVEAACLDCRVLTISVGVAARLHETMLETLLARADHALAAAKRGGRNRVETG